MPEDFGQGNSAPADGGQGGEAPQIVEVGGEQMPIDKLVKSYQEIRSMETKNNQRLSEMQRKLEGYSWADSVLDRYNTDPQFRQVYDKAWNGMYGDEDDGGSRQTNYQQNPLSPERQRLDNLERSYQTLQYEREMDRLRGEGKQITPENEQEIFDYMARRNVYDVEAAYGALYYQRDIENARKEASKNTAEHMAENRNSYSAPPEGSMPSHRKPDVSKMNEQEFDNALLGAIKEMDIYKKPW